MGSALRVLVVEDDLELARKLELALIEAGHTVTVVHDGSTALEQLRVGVDVCLLDVGLPDLDGFSVVEQARQEGVTTPLVLLTARCSLVDRVAGLRGGADDYVTKPFELPELLARMEAVTRRRLRQQPRLHGLELDLASRRAHVGAVELSLTRSQFDLLAYLIEHAGEAVTRYTLLDRVLGYEFDPGTNVVDAHVSNLRTKLAAHTNLRIVPVRGVGYRLENG